MAIPFEELGALAKAAEEEVSEGGGLNLLDAIGGAKDLPAPTAASHLGISHTSSLLNQYRDSFGVSFDTTPSNGLLMTNVGQTPIRFQGWMPKGQDINVHWIGPGEQHLLAASERIREVTGSLSPLGSDRALKFSVPADSAEVGFHVDELAQPTTLPVLPKGTIYGNPGNIGKYLAGLLKSQVYGKMRATAHGWELETPHPASYGLKIAGDAIDNPPLLSGLGRESQVQIADYAVDPGTGKVIAKPGSRVIAGTESPAPGSDKPKLPRPAHSGTRTPGAASGVTDEKPNQLGRL